MTTTPATDQARTPAPNAGDFRLEVVVIPVVSVDRALQFYAGALGWRVDADFTVDDGLRVVQVTPPGSGASIIFGDKVTAAVAGSIDSLLLAVRDIDAARAELISRGAVVSPVFHDAGGVFHHSGTSARVPGRSPQAPDYASFASFADPDGNTWYLQEIQSRGPGR
ncbi:VOC family protein [Occultella gossypii]|uniref:VOC family protein n=1 Tax=Occultella gossypii TaxID=2800820 RepID=A0ABS7S9V4_9MICO|nr:VOC family protein [Occultella gossypii]MBZ2196028.1 VOC family protein [Occultella gossypii]